VSVQFGRWNIDGRPTDQDYLARAREMLAPYGPDGGGAYIKDNVGILFRGFHTTKESRKEAQPYVTPSGAVVCWDGRLDNREEFIRELREAVTADSTDLAIVVAAYEAWGTECFAKLIGDWALSVWDPRCRSLILAKDPIGTRHLYYSSDQNQIIWSTILDPMVLLAGKTFTLEEEYIAGWLSFFPASHLTPYVGIHSAPPSCFVRLEPGRQIIKKYWDFDPSKKIRYQADAEYEQHFRKVFAESVKRRLRADSPILAELSGGMDSSSIVCMADSIIAGGAVETLRLDTVSYYDDSEPNWNERPYFIKVEQKRGRPGCHINVGKRKSLFNRLEPQCFAATPAFNGRISEAELEYTACLNSQGNRVVLSGTGGDEVMGGVPTPIPELEDLLAKAKLRTLTHRLKLWALNKRQPWVNLLVEAARGFFPPTLVGFPKQLGPPPWLRNKFFRRNRAASTGYQTRVRLLGSLPSFQDNLSTLEVLRRQVFCSVLSADPAHEKRYPYLDRELLEFIYAVPREQVVRPGHRRSLMRRALVGVVPDELLNRKRKAFIVRAPLMDVSSEWPRLIEITRDMVSSSFGIVDRDLFVTGLKKARCGDDTPAIPLLRLLAIECWLQSLRDWKLLHVVVSRAEKHWFRNILEFAVPDNKRKIDSD